MCIGESGSWDTVRPGTIYFSQHNIERKDFFQNTTHILRYNDFLLLYYITLLQYDSHNSHIWILNTVTSEDE